MKAVPFKYGGVVRTPYFIDREREVEELTLSLAGGASVILYSPRRYGKTSLIHRVSDELGKQGITVVYLDFFQVNSREKFLLSYLQAIFSKASRWERMARRISTLIRSARPVLTLGHDGTPALTLESSSPQSPNLFKEVVNLPEKLAGEKRWVVVFDEFQEVANLDGEQFEKELRAIIQHHQQVSYVLMGSRKHLLLAMVTRKSRAFYLFGKLVRLEKIPEDVWIPFIREGLKKAGFSVDRRMASRIVEAADGIPYYVQYLAKEVMECGLIYGKVEESTIERAFERMLNNQNDYFRTLWESLSYTQQQTLMALAHENKGVFSRGYLDRHRLHTVSGIQRAIAVLIEKGIVDRQEDAYIFEDPLLRKWLLEEK